MNLTTLAVVIIVYVVLVFAYPEYIKYKIHKKLETEIVNLLCEMNGKLIDLGKEIEKLKCKSQENERKNND